jgi:hypothetical protein
MGRTYGYTDAIISEDDTRAGAVSIVGNALLGVPGCRAMHMKGLQ